MMRKLYLILLFIFLCVSCSNEEQLLTAPSIPQIHLGKTQLPDHFNPLVHFMNPCDEECQYQAECWECDLYFCAPLDAVWQ